VVKFDSNPITCGRRNCAVCGRWRLIIDFKWRWYKSGHIRNISTVCVPCINAKGRAYWKKKSKAERSIIGRRNNEQAHARRNRDREALAEAEHELAQLRAITDIPPNHVDFQPFRMWLLWHVREFRSPNAMAERAHKKAVTVQDWLNGYEWNDVSCEPVPIRSVKLRDVENVTTYLGHPEAVYGLYPAVYDR